MNKKKLLIVISFLVVILGISLFIFLKINNSNSVNNESNQNNQSNNQIDNEEDNSITPPTEGEDNMDEFQSKINISINGTNYTVTLEDNATTREFIKKLPLELEMDELNGNEKYYYFDDSLPSNSSRIGKISSGDLMLYGSDCLVLFYESFNTSYSYTRIGKIDNPSSLKSNVGKGSIRISFTK